MGDLSFLYLESLRVSGERGVRVIKFITLPTCTLNTHMILRTVHHTLTLVIEVRVIYHQLVLRTAHWGIVLDVLTVGHLNWHFIRSANKGVLLELEFICFDILSDLGDAL